MQSLPLPKDAVFADLLATIEQSQIVPNEAAVRALGYVRDGIITGEGPTTEGRVHFSRSIDETDTAWCERILIAAGGRMDAPVSRAEAEALFQINEAASDRADDGAFDALLARAVVHHAASASGLPVPPRAIALSPLTPIESWAPTKAVGVNTEILEWISAQMRGRRRSRVTLMGIVALLVGATTIPVAQSLASIADYGL